jgi:hypothetical protein
MLKFKSKKGDVTDILSFVIVIFVLMVGFFIISFTIPYITNGLKTNGLNNTSEGINAIQTLDDFGSNGIQKGMLFLFIGLSIGVLISSFYADTHPIWLFLYIFMLVISIILAAYLGNAYQTIIENDTLSSWNQSYMAAIMQNIIKIVIGVGALSFIIMFVKGVFFGGGNSIP